MPQRDDTAGTRRTSYAVSNPETDRRIAALVGTKRYPLTVRHAEAMTAEERARYGLTDWCPKSGRR